MPHEHNFLNIFYVDVHDGATEKFRVYTLRKYLQSHDLFQSVTWNDIHDIFAHFALYVPKRLAWLKYFTLKLNR